jgi:hypothetical protein
VAHNETLSSGPFVIGTGPDLSSMGIDGVAEVFVDYAPEMNPPGSPGIA